jgi:hypothetical protein
MEVCRGMDSLVQGKILPTSGCVAFATFEKEKVWRLTHVTIYNGGMPISRNCHHPALVHPMQITDRIDAMHPCQAFLGQFVIGWWADAAWFLRIVP